jgi:predicted dehydrogenase
MLHGCRLLVCCDIDPARAAALADKIGCCEPETDWKRVVRRQDIDLVIIATTHDMLARIAAEAARFGKHVLIEKPGARRAIELEPVIHASAQTGALVRVGFNHRYHRTFQKAYEIFESGELGPMMFIRGRYGHGGRPGYEKEWRADPEKSGGGEAMDQAVHLVDLSRWFLGDVASVRGSARTYFWDMPVEDNAFLLLESNEGQTAFLHASWTEWKNIFSFEIYGKYGKLEITGLGGSYGVERLTYYRMAPEMGPPETTVWEYPMADDSWKAEFFAFVEDIRLGRQPVPGPREAQAALRVIEEMYQDSEESMVRPSRAALRAVK